MQTTRTLTRLFILTIAAIAAPLGGCDRGAEPARPATGTAAVPGDHTHGNDGGHGATTSLGEQSAGGFTIRASRDGVIKPGGDAPIDVWVTGGAAKVSAVRFWIGTQDAKGSVKVKAEIERDNWHSHAEVPNPMPAGSKLWVEVEADSGEKSVVGFDLKA